MDACRCCRVAGWIHHIRPINELIERLFVCKVIRLKFVSFFSSSNNGGKNSSPALRRAWEMVCLRVCVCREKGVCLYGAQRGTALQFKSRG